MKIRSAKKADINKIYKLGKKVHELDFSKKYPFHERGELLEALKDKNSILLVAEEMKEIVGFLYAKVIFHRAGGWCMLDNLAVEKDFREKGIAELLLKELYAHLRKNKISYIQILEGELYKKTRRF
jgi:predicted N-acetyltransferase YhbS